MRLSQFSELIQDEFGPDFAPVVLSDTRLGKLGDKTATELISSGEEPAVIWRAICEQLQVPKDRWHGKSKIKRHAE